MAEKTKHTRGPTYLADVWAIKPNKKRIQVAYNRRGQPIGVTKKKLTGYLGTLARNGQLAPLDIDDWRKVPKVRKEEMINLVKVIILFYFSLFNCNINLVLIVSDILT